MEFLESLYEIENFGIYLFVIIGILVVLFLVVLFFGRKDQKAQKSIEGNSLKDTDKIVKEETLFKEVSAPQPVEVAVSENPLIRESSVFEPIKNEEVMPTTNVVLNSAFNTEPQEETPATEKEFDFDALADAISKELETIDKNTSDEQPEIMEKMPVVEENLKEPEPVLPPIEENNFQIFEPVKMEPTIEPVIEEKVELPIEENKEVIRTRPSMPAVFSSVYVNREKEEIKPTPIPEPVKVEETFEEVVAPIKPAIELPKMVDLPKRVEEPSTIKPILDEKNEEMIFPSINN